MVQTCRACKKETSEYLGYIFPRNICSSPPGLLFLHLTTCKHPYTALQAALGGHSGQETFFREALASELQIQTQCLRSWRPSPQKNQMNSVKISCSQKT